MIRKNSIKQILLCILIAVTAFSLFAFAGCGDKPEEESKHIHSWGEYTTVKDATCIENGVKERVCSGCGEKETVTTDKTDHNFGGWIAEVPATCTEDGVKGHKDCSVCHKHFDADGNEIEDLTIEKGHNFGAWAAPSGSPGASWMT